MGATPYRICVRCIMDVSDPEITFDAAGVCDRCAQYDVLARRLVRTDAAGRQELDALVAEIKDKGRRKPYDCIIGVSGGVDSTYVAHVVKQFGLRPLAIHLDNGWDSELAVSNIEKVLNLLGIDLQTCVLDWEEFRDLQLSFLRASVPDAEIPSDHAIGAAVYRAALEHGISYVISGSNVVTEGILPRSWTYGVSDWHYIRSVHRRFGSTPLRTYPHYSFFDLLWFMFVRGVKTVRILDYVPYVKKDALTLLQNELGWQYYGGKHYESIYTRFFQGYILPRKFGIDKRRAHLATLICSGQISREAALAEMELPRYPENLLREDREYVIKKLGLTEAEFEALMEQPLRSHRDYPTSSAYFEGLRSVGRFARRLGFRQGKRRLNM